jgi:hypothetical protein
MSTDQFIASLVNSFAWPLAVVCIAVVFRAQLKTLLTERLSHIKAGPVEADFERLRSDVQAELGKPVLSSTTQPDTKDLAALAERIPAAAIIEAYMRVEQELREILTTAGKAISDPDDARPLAHIALDSGLITPKTVNAVEGITVMRHLAVHGPRRDVSVRQAQEYVVLVNTLLYAIRQNVRSSEASSVA